MVSAYDNIILSEAGLAAFYPLNEASGTVAHDLSANGYNGAINGGVTLGVASLLAQDAETCMTFDGVSGQITLPVGLDLSTFTALTLELWCIVGSTPNNAMIANSNSITSNLGAGLFTNGSNIYSSVGKSGSGSTVADGQTPIYGYTYHLALTWDGATLRLYKNGAEIYTSVAFAGPIAASGHALAIGYEPATAAQFFHGQIQKVAIYHAALSPGRIVAHYLAGSIAAKSGYLTVVGADSPARFYVLDDAVGSATARDRSSNAIAATATGVTFGNPGLLPGKTAATFAGAHPVTETSQVGLPASGGGTAGSIEMWYKVGADPAVNPSYANVGNMNLLNESGLNPPLMEGYNGTAGVGGTPFLLNAWHHAVFVYNGAGSFTFYLDGVPHTAAGTLAWTYAANAITIGGNSNPPQAAAAFAAYATALTQAQVTTHYNAALYDIQQGVPSNAPTASWPHKRFGTRLA